MDDRFDHVFKDPRFQRVPVKEKKLKIDQRFKGMFNDKRFSLKYTVDKRGRPINSSTSENLQKYYKLSDEDDEVEDMEEMDGSEFLSEDKKKKKLKKKKEVKKDNQLISNGVNCNTNEGISDPKKSANDSMIKNKKTKTSEKAEIDKNTNLQRKRKLSSEDHVLKSKKNVKKKSRKVFEVEAKENDNESEENDVSENEESGDSESGSGPDLARGIGNESSSSDDSENDSESDDEPFPSATEEIVHNWGEFDKDVPLTSELSRRLAVCNVDWDNITATDIFVVFNSFKSPEGTVLSVKIFLSDFGRQRMQEEVAKGPAELSEIAIDADSSDDEGSSNENDEGKSFHNEKLREYQLNRMKYYYAVVECDTMETANYIYNELDGAEYESSKTCFDLRFIPDDMEFDKEFKDICTELPNNDVYKPNQFLSTALSEAEVALTWDETDKKRLETTTKNYNKKHEIKLEDFKDYLALSSEEEDDEDKEASNATLVSNSDIELNDEKDASSEDEDKLHINKYKKLLEGIEETERKKEKQIEVTWDIGLKEKTEKILKNKEKKNSSPWNEFLVKMKEKQKKRKTKIKALKKSADPNDTKQTFSDDEIPSDIDFNDPYFSSELLSASKKKSKTQKKKEKKLQREAKHSDLIPEEIDQKKQEMAELALLMADEDDVNPKHHFDYEKIIKQESKIKPKKKVKAAKVKDHDDFKLDLNDDRFSAIYTSSLFNIDKSAPEYKKSAAMEALIEEKLRQRYTAKECSEKDKLIENSKPGIVPTRSLVDRTASSQTSTNIDQSVNSLVHSIKTKTKKFNFSKTKPDIKNVIWKKLPQNL